MMNLLRRIASLPGVRGVLLRPRVRSALASVLALRFLRAARLTTSPIAFVYHDLIGARHQLRSYPLRGGGQVSLVHRRDTEAFCELWVTGEYEPPTELRDRLSGIRTILDVGGNIGMFANWAITRWPKAHVISIEPDPENTAVFRQWLEETRPRVQLVEACATTGAATMRHSDGAGAGSQFSVDCGPVDAGPGVVPGVDIFEYLDKADLVKMDIEGGEWPILADSRLAELSQIALVMEYHRVGAPSLPPFDAAKALLTTAGFTIGQHRPNHWGHGVLWAWKD